MKHFLKILQYVYKSSKLRNSLFLILF